VHFVISYLDNIYLAITNEFICQKLVEIGKSKDIYPLVLIEHRSISFYFKKFDYLNNYKENFVNIKFIKITQNIYCFRFGLLV